VKAEELRQLQAPFKARYKQDPAAAKHTFRASGTLLQDRPACRIESAFGTIDAGLHPAAGGDGSDVCAGDLMLQSLVACAGVTFNSVATAMSIPFRSAKVMVEGDGDFRGTLGVAQLQEELARRKVTLVTRWPADATAITADGAAAAADEDVFALQLPTLLLANKADLLDHADTDLEVLAELEEPHFPAMLVSAQSGLGLGDLGAWLWRQLGLVRVYTKAPGKPPENSRPFTLRAGEQTVEDAARLVHRDMARTLKYARVWGRSVAADGQHVGREHRLADRDILELHA